MLTPQSLKTLALTLLASAIATLPLRAGNDAAVDTNFQDPGLPADAYVETILPVASGKIYVQGANFLFFGPNSQYSNFIRLNSDGSLDTTFDPSGGGTFKASPFSLVAQSTGKVLIDGVNSVGTRTNYPGITRFNVDGTFDPTFNSQPLSENQVTMLVQPNDAIVLVGSVNYPSGTNSPTFGSIARVGADGALDTSFPITQLYDSNGDTSFPQHAALQSDGKILVAGTFNYFGESTPCSQGLARINSDGTLDTGFVLDDSANLSNDRVVGPVAALAGAMVLAAGDLELPGITVGLARLNSNGSVDATFHSGTFAVSAADTYGTPSFNTILVQANGQIVVGGNFVSYDGVPRANLVRLNADGTLDNTFDPGTGSSGGDEGGVITALTDDASGRLLVGGDFTNFDASAYTSIVRLGGPSASPNLTATALLVNGSNNPSTVAAGAALTFTATQGAAASSGVYVRVQATTTPTLESSWTDLTDTTNGGAGFLKGDGSGNYTLNTAKYPIGTNIFFRAIAAASGQTDSISNDVGPFSLANAVTVDLVVDQEATDPSAHNADLALVGQEITYSFFVRNYGPQTAFGVKVLDVLPPSLRFVSADNSFVKTGVPTDGKTGGGTITWKIGDLPPNPMQPIVLKLVAVVTKFPPINSTISNNGFAVEATGVPSIQGKNAIVTKVESPIELGVETNPPNPRPGTTLVYAFQANNISGVEADDVKIEVPLPPNLVFKKAEFTNDAGQPLLKAPAVTVNSGDVIFDIGTLKAQGTVYFHVTVSIPYDVDPALTVSIENVAITTSTQLDGSNSFSVPIANVKLTGKPPQNPPSFALFKFVPDGLTILQLLAESSEVKAFFDKKFPGADTQDGSLALGAFVNPDILDTTSADGTYQQGVFAPGEQNGPATSRITYALILSNNGGFPALNVELTDQIPLGTKLDTSSAYTPTFNGVPFSKTELKLDPNGHTLHFSLGDIKPPTLKKDGSVKTPSLGLVLYTVDLLKAGGGGVSLGSPVQAQGGALSTDSLLRTTYAQPNEIDTYVTAPGSAYVESYKGTAQAVVGGQIPYDIYYRNTGGITPDDFRIEDDLPAGTSFVSAYLLNNDHLRRSAKSGETIAGPSNGKITFHLGALKPGAGGFVRLIVKVEDSAMKVPGLLITNNPTVPATVFPANSKSELIGPRTEGTQPLPLSPLASCLSASPVVLPPTQPAIPHLNDGLMVPESVVEGSTYSCLVFVGNPTNTPIGKTAVVVPVPPGAEFVSGSDSTGSFTGELLKDSSGNPIVYFPSTARDDGSKLIDNLVSPHAAVTFRLTFRAPSGSVGKKLVTSVYTESTTYSPKSAGVSVAPVYSANVSTYVYAKKDTFADVAPQIVASELETSGTSVAAQGSAKYIQLIAQLTPTTFAQATGGTDVLALSDNVVAVRLLGPGGGGSGNVVVLGPMANLAAAGASSLIGEDGSSIVAQGGGNAITALNLIGEDGSSIVAQGGGNLQALFAGIVAQGGGNIVAQGGGNILNMGGNNIISQDGNGVISNDGGSIVAFTQAGIVAQGGGNIVAAGGGNIVAQGGGNIVAQGGGNIVAQGGGNIVAQGGGNIVAQGGGNIVNAGGGLIKFDGSSLASPDATIGSSAAGGGIVAAGGGNIVAQGGGN